MPSEDTPLIQQWREVKARHPDAIVLFRVGDFYEMFHEDAVEGARLLDLTLTSRNNGSSRAPLAGVPAAAIDTYLERLVGLGRRVAICEQVENPAEARGIVRREVTETISPGAVFSESLLDSRRNNFLIALSGDPGPGHTLGLASADLSTGDLILRACPWEELSGVLGRLDPAELLMPRSWEMLGLTIAERALRTYREDALFDPVNSADELKRRFGVLSLEGFGLGSADAVLVCACGALLAYLAEVQPVRGAHLRPPRVERPGDSMVLDEMTCRNLELVSPLQGSGAEATLIGVIDLALTPMGGRLLRRWVLAPLVDEGMINARQAAVAELVVNTRARGELREALRQVSDLERLAVKIGRRRAGPRDLLVLNRSVAQVPSLRSALEAFDAGLLRECGERLDPLDDVGELVGKGIDPDAPAQVSDGGYIRAGYSTELDELREARDGAVEWIAKLQTRERQRTGIASLKVGFNKVFGYYIEVTRSNLERVPDDYFRKQTLSNAERFVTPELKEWEERVLGAEDRIATLEAQLFADLRESVAARVPGLQELAEVLAVLDVLFAFAELAVRRNFVRPDVDADFEIDIRGGRHPVVETMMPAESFIPNDIRLHPSERIIVLTGPNMAGKSTVLRQVGLITLLAQIGSFVPASRARIGIVDRIFTRVGASDNLARGQSTFMVEMHETASILHHASARSLVLLDEVGRGTSTWDGLSVATAVTEHLHDRIGAKTIFATHYHELTRLADRLEGVVNFSVAVREDGAQILFLRRLVRGGADRSYGVEVARLAGLPAEVVARARELLRDLEREGVGELRARGTPTSRVQLTLFEPTSHPALERLRALDPNQLTPLEALNLLAELAALTND